MKSIRLKLFLVVSLVVVITGCAALFSIRSFNQLTVAIDQLSTPNQKLILLNTIFQNLVSKENYLHRYIITGEDSFEKIYKDLAHQTYEDIHQLKLLTKDNNKQWKRIDSLELLLRKKMEDLNGFLSLKQRGRTISFATIAKEQIKANTSDTIETQKEVYIQQKNIHGGNPRLKEEVIVYKDSSRGIWNSIKRLLGNKYIYDTITLIEPNFYRYVDISVDTALIKSYSPDTVLSRVNQILEKVEISELAFQRKLTTQELSILKQDQMLTHQMSSLINEIQSSEEQIAKQKSAEALQTAKKATVNIIRIGLLGLMVVGILLSLITRDITQAFFLRRKLEDAKAKAEKLAEVKDRFLTNMSHEIRTPLNSILGFVRLLHKTNMNDHQIQYLEAVDVSSDYLNTLVNDILDYSKIVSGKLSLSAKPFETTKLISDLNVMFSNIAKDKQLEFCIDRTLQVPDWLLGDGFRIKQILYNLVSNALKFTYIGKIEVSFDGYWFKEQFFLKIEVRDTGIGISSEKLTAIFSSFTQEEPTIADRFGGTGLGLSICKELTTAMKGAIRVESKKGAGAVFTVTLPLQILSNNEVPARTLESEKKSIGFEGNIIVVDDDHWNAILLKTILEQYQLQVNHFLNPEQALEHIKSHLDEIDLLFTDVKMPGINGTTLAKKCRKAGFDKPIILLTANLQSKKIAPGMLDIQGVCSKPYKEEDIIQLLAEFLPKKEVFSKDEPIEKISSETVIPNFPDLRKFSGGDDIMFNELLVEFVTNNARQVKNFRQLTRCEKWTELSELAHQMVPSYDQLRLYQISELLKSIELFAAMDNWKRMKETVEEVTPLLEKEVSNLLEISHQYHTS